MSINRKVYVILVSLTVVTLVNFIYSSMILTQCNVPYIYYTVSCTVRQYIILAFKPRNEYNHYVGQQYPNDQIPSATEFWYKNKYKQYIMTIHPVEKVLYIVMNAYRFCVCLYCTVGVDHGTIPLLGSTILGLFAVL